MSLARINSATSALVAPAAATNGSGIMISRASMGGNVSAAGGLDLILTEAFPNEVDRVLMSHPAVFESATIELPKSAALKVLRRSRQPAGGPAWSPGTPARGTDPPRRRRTAPPA